MLYYKRQETIETHASSVSVTVSLYSELNIEPNLTMPKYNIQ
jgi:hypothetical protein